MKKKRITFLLLLLILLTVNSYSKEFAGHSEENVVDVYDTDGKYIFSTAMGVVAGDRYINEANIEYIVKEVNLNKGIAHNHGRIDYSGVDLLKTNIPMLTFDNRVVGLYNTHNDESYKPGPTSVNGQGEVYNVAKSLKNALESKGVKVILSNNLHLPHDGAAYERSRATAMDLVKNGTDAVFDIHRDAVPNRNYYLKKVNSKLISQVRLVVGRQNPNEEVNNQFALSLKKTADKKYPGLIKGIFYGHGSYNQQMSTRALLFEFGTHVTTEGEAEASAVMLADSINTLLYGGEGVEPFVSNKSVNNSSFRAVAWILGLTILGVLVFLFINEGSWTGVLKRLRSFISREIIERKE